MKSLRQPAGSPKALVQGDHAPRCNKRRTVNAGAAAAASAAAAVRTLCRNFLAFRDIPAELRVSWSGSSTVAPAPMLLLPQVAAFTSRTVPDRKVLLVGLRRSTRPVAVESHMAPGQDDPVPMGAVGFGKKWGGRRRS